MENSNVYVLSPSLFIVTEFLLVFHPKYHCHWFQGAQWPAAWVDTAVSEAQDIWSEKYKPTVVVPTKKSVPDCPKDEFAVLDAPVAHTDCDPFDDFINGPQSNEDPIFYWLASLPLPKSKPTMLNQALAHMALDFLAAPAASTDVERLFSHSGLVVAKCRYNLTAEHIRQSTVLGNWLSIPDLAPVKAISKCLDKCSRKAKVIDPEFSE